MRSEVQVLVVELDSACSPHVSPRAQEWACSRKGQDGALKGQEASECLGSSLLPYLCSQEASVTCLRVPFPLDQLAPVSTHPR